MAKTVGALINKRLMLWNANKDVNIILDTTTLNKNEFFHIGLCSMVYRVPFHDLDLEKLRKTVADYIAVLH